MKKIIFALTIIIGSSTLLCAQNIQFGVKGGINLSNLSVSPVKDPPAPAVRLGLNIGGFAELGIIDNLLFRPEIMISTQGANDEDQDVTQTVKLTYLNTALLVKYNIAGGINIFAGPQVGLLVGGKFVEEDRVSGEQNVFNANAVYKGTDISLGLGAGYDLDMGLSIDLRYNHGLTNNNDDQLGNAFYDIDQVLKSRVVQINLSYKF